MEKNRRMRTVRQVAAVVFVFMAFTAVQGLCASPKKVAVIPFFINSPQDLEFLQNGLFSMLSSRLSDPGKVDVLDRETVDTVMAAANQSGQIKGSLNDATARIIGANLAADYILFGSLTNFGESVSLDARMVDITAKKPTLTFFKQSNTMGDVIPMVNTFAGDINLKVFNRSINTEMYAAPQQQGASEAAGALIGAGSQAPGYSGGFVNLQQSGRKGFATHLKFKGQINALAVGDVNKDGVLQVVTATDSDVIIYKMDGNRLLVDKKLEFPSSNRIVALDIADINQNGTPEIFVTSLNILRENLQSFVLEYSGSAYKTITDKESYYYRVINGPDQSKLLLGQKAATHPFKGSIYTLTASGNAYVRGKPLAMPRSASVLSLARGAVTAENTEGYVTINEHGRLSVVTDTGKIDWESNAKYGGTENFYLLPLNDPDASYQERVYLNPRILFYDVGNDGKSEIFVIRNEDLGGGAVGRYKRFSKGNLEILAWNGIALAPVLKTRSVEGWISDFAIADIDNDGVDELVVSVVGRSKILIDVKAKTSNIISYKLN